MLKIKNVNLKLKPFLVSTLLTTLLKSLTFVDLQELVLCSGLPIRALIHQTTLCRPLVFQTRETVLLSLDLYIVLR